MLRSYSLIASPIVGNIIEAKTCFIYLVNCSIYLLVFISMCILFQVLAHAKRITEARKSIKVCKIYSSAVVDSFILCMCEWSLISFWCFLFVFRLLKSQRCQPYQIVDCLVLTRIMLPILSPLPAILSFPLPQIQHQKLLLLWLLFVRYALIRQIDTKLSSFFLYFSFFLYKLVCH